MKILSLTTIVATLMTSVLARSSVHMVNSVNSVEHLETKPEISMNAFSMFYSHMMDTTSKHPALLLQDVAQKEAIEGAQEIASFLPQSSDVFTKKVNANLMVIISGVQSPQDILTTHDTSFFVSNDEPETYSSLVEDTFKQMDSEDITVTAYKNQKEEIRLGKNVVEVTSRLANEEPFEYFKANFPEIDNDVFDMENKVDRDFVTEVAHVKKMYSTERKYEPFDMRIIEINTLETLAQEYGLDSKQYKEAHLVLRDLFEKFVIPNFQQLYETGVTSTFILTPIAKQQNKRRDVYTNRLVAAPVSDSCFKTISACKNSTANCSGNGQCTEVSEGCFSCQCKSPSHVGDSCQYIDAVNDFQLLFWTSVLLVVITASVVVCVYQSGNIVDGGVIMAQSLPKQD